MSDPLGSVLGSAKAGPDKVQLGLRLFKRAEALKEKRRTVFDPIVQEIYDYFMPDLSDINTEKTENTTGWFDRIFDTAPIRAVNTCSVGIRNWVTPSTEPWLDLSPPANLPAAQQGPPAPENPRLKRLRGPDPQANAMDDAKRWCSGEAEGILTDLQASNFYSIVQPFNRAACTSGTALMFCEEGKAEALCFEQFKFGTFAIAENDQKIVDTVFRWFKLTVRQAVQKFCQGAPGEAPDLGRLPKKMQQEYEKEKLDTEYHFIHCCFPNEDYTAGNLGNEGKAVASVYISEQEKKVVQEGGYDEMPYFALRFTRWGTDGQVYGCSPAFEVLSEARQINYVTQFDDALVEQRAFPRVFVPDSLDGDVEMAPGGATIIKADDMARGVVPKEWMTEGQRNDVQDKLDRKTDAINKAFFVDIFTALSQLDDKITQSTYGAIALLKGEKLDQFTGTFDQYRTELINPLVRRVMGIRIRSGRSQSPPDSMMVRPGNDPKSRPQLAVPKIEIKSRVTLALNEVKNIGVEKTFQVLVTMMEQHPEIADNFDLDSTARGVARNSGMPETYRRKWDDMQAMRQQRTKMIQEERALEMAQGAAKAGKDLGKSPKPMQDAAMGQLAQFSQAANQ